MYYPGHIIMYAMSPSRIETLEEGNVLMGNLEKVGWVVLNFEIILLHIVIWNMNCII